MPGLASLGFMLEEDVGNACDEIAVAPSGT
jgi:hypothetical protein